MSQVNDKGLQGILMEGKGSVQLTSSDESFLTLKKNWSIFTKQAILMRRPNVLTLQYGFPEDYNSKGLADISFK
jgi:hypothetical protein